MLSFLLNLKKGLSLKYPYVSLAGPHGTHLGSHPVISLNIKGQHNSGGIPYLQCTEEIWFGFLSVPWAHLFP